MPARHAIQAALAAACATMVLAGTAAAETRVVDQVAAAIGADIITLSDMRDRAGRRLGSLFTPSPNPDVERQRETSLRELLDSMIEEKLVAGEVKKLQMEATEGEIDRVIEDVLTRNKITREQLDGELARLGQTPAQYRQQMRFQVERAKVMDFKVRSRVKVSDEDIRNYYTQHYNVAQAERYAHVRHILVTLAPDASAEAVAAAQVRIADAQARLAAGEDFATVAGDSSDDPSKRRGGDLGWFKRGQFVPEFEQAVFAMHAGDVSSPVRTEFGLHLIKLEGFKAGDVAPFNEAKDEIRNRLLQDAVEREYKVWIAELRKHANVSVYMQFPALSETDPTDTPAAAPTDG